MPPEVTVGVAIAVPEPAASQLQSWRSSFGDPLAEMIPAHVTLLPPTHIPVDEMEKVRHHLHDVACSAAPFTIVLRGTGSFRPVSPVVFVQVAEGVGSCELLEQRVRSGPLERPLAFPYHPHVTVAHDLDQRAMDRAAGALAMFSTRFRVTAFTLYEHREGMWRPERDFALAGSGRR